MTEPDDKTDTDESPTDSTTKDDGSYTNDDPHEDN